MRPQHLDRHLASSVGTLAQGGKVHLRNGSAGHGLTLKVSEHLGQRLAIRTLDGGHGHLSGKRRHPVLQARQLVGDVRGQQIPPGRQHLAKLHKNRAQALQCLAQTLAAGRGQVPSHRHHPGEQPQPPMLEAGEHQLVQTVAQHHPHNKRAAPPAAQPPAHGARSAPGARDADAGAAAGSRSNAERA